MTPEEIVRDFFRMWEEEGLVEGYAKYIHPDILYQNTGMEDRTDKEEILENLRTYVKMGKMPYSRVEILTLMSEGNVVVAERIDHMFSKENNNKHDLPVMGTFIIEDGLIKVYRDYFDPRGVMATHEGHVPQS